MESSASPLGTMGGRRPLPSVRMDQRQLRFYCRIVELGSFSRAARALDVARPSLSHRIKHLVALLCTTSIGAWNCRRLAPRRGLGAGWLRERARVHWGMGARPRAE